MGYYENPPMVNMNAGYDKVTQGILNMSQSIAQGLITAGERKRAQEKEERLTIKELQKQKNEIDLLYNNKLSDWSEKNKVTSLEVDDKVRNMIQGKISLAADARIALLNETDQSKRSAYLKTIRDVDGFLDNSAKFSQIFAAESASYRENVNGVSYGVPGGMVINGTPEQIEGRTMAINIMSGMTQKYKSHSIDIEDSGAHFKLRIKAVGMDGKEYEQVVDSSSYLSSDEGGTGTFLQKVANNDEWVKTANKVFYDEKSENILQKYLNQNVEKVHIPVLDAKGKDTGAYSLGKGQRLNIENIKNDLAPQAEIKAQAYLKAGKDADLRAFLNCTLKKDTYYYDTVFKDPTKTPDQVATLKQLLIDDALGKITSNLRTTKEKGLTTEKTVYWDKNTIIDEDTVYKPNKDKNNSDKEPKESIESIVKKILAVRKGDIAEFIYKGRKISYDGANFMIERTAGLKNLVLGETADVLNYIKTGTTSKPKPKTETTSKPKP